MLRFNLVAYLLLMQLILISIHLMLRFNTYGGKDRPLVCSFQYILCCGSTQAATAGQNNQSGISIHLMLRFNTVEHHDVKKKQANFNTSYVAVQLNNQKL